MLYDVICYTMIAIVINGNDLDHATSRVAMPPKVGRSHTILYYTILCYAILYYTILYYTILYYNRVCVHMPKVGRSRSPRPIAAAPSPEAATRAVITSTIAIVLLITSTTT